MVVDDRESYANRERFPDAREVIAEDFEAVIGASGSHESSYIVIVTRGHRDDMRVLRWAVQTPARYIGMIGSKRKTIAIFNELRGRSFRRHLFQRVHAPVGLDIGAVTPEEIAVAIAAEMIASAAGWNATLPHMSWFHRRSGKVQRSGDLDREIDDDAPDETAGAIEGSE